MIKRLTPKDFPGWPRVMTRTIAAAYVGVSPTIFDREYKHLPSIKTGGCIGWDRDDLDVEVDKKKTFSLTGSDIDERIGSL